DNPYHLVVPFTRARLAFSGLARHVAWKGMAPASERVFEARHVVQPHLWLWPLGGARCQRCGAVDRFADVKNAAPWVHLVLQVPGTSDPQDQPGIPAGRVGSDQISDPAVDPIQQVCIDLDGQPVKGLCAARAGLPQDRGLRPVIWVALIYVGPGPLRGTPVGEGPAGLGVDERAPVHVPRAVGVLDPSENHFSVLGPLKPAFNPFAVHSPVDRDIHPAPLVGPHQVKDGFTHTALPLPYWNFEQVPQGLLTDADGALAHADRLKLAVSDQAANVVFADIQ